MSAAFQPITKANAAAVLDVSLRTIDSWVASGLMPAPQNIGRHVYWHPEDFYEWLNARLRSRDRATTKVRAKSLEVNAAAYSKVKQPPQRQNTRRGSAEAARQRDEARLEKIKAS